MLRSLGFPWSRNPIAQPGVSGAGRIKIVPCYILYDMPFGYGACLPPSPCPELPTRAEMTPLPKKEPGLASQPVHPILQATEPDTGGHLKTA